MEIRNVSVPKVYTRESADFRFFIEWFRDALQKVQYDTENLIDLYDPLRCPQWLLWLLAATMGFKYDDRLPTSFNRLVLVYFMSMIHMKGSKDGILLAAETNLAQFNVLDYCKEDDIYTNRLHDTSIPVNSAYVTPHVEAGYIDVIYFSDKKPVDACIEYVRPLGMYLFQHAGVRFDTRTKISVDARLTHTHDMWVSIGPTHVGHYNRDAYASLQRMRDEEQRLPSSRHRREEVWYRNSKAEGDRDPMVNPGWRALFSLQLANNEHILHSLIPDAGDNPDPDNVRHDPDKIFSLGYGPQDVSTKYPDSYLKPPYADKPVYNLRYDRELEESISPDVYTVEADRTTSVIRPRPAVNPPMRHVGDAISLDKHNSRYTHTEGPGGEDITIVNAEDL